ncbi:MAG: YfiR family protein [Terracidiphilus sp.]
MAPIVLCVIATIASAQSRVSEYDVKAAYLFNFGKFVRFTPPDAEIKRESFDICIVGDDPLGAPLDKLTANEALDGKPVRVVRLKTAGEARGCAIAYFGASEGTRVKSDLEALRGQPVLTVSDAGNFLQNGGMIKFVLHENHIRFAVNLDAVRNARLGLSSELLRVAISVNGESPAEVQP